MKSIVILFALVSVVLVEAGQNSTDSPPSHKIQIIRDVIDESIDLVNLYLKAKKLGYLEYYNPNIKNQEQLQEQRQNKQERQQQQKELQKKLREVALQQQLVQIQKELQENNKSK